MRIEPRDEQLLALQLALNEYFSARNAEDALEGSKEHQAYLDARQGVLDGWRKCEVVMQRIVFGM